MSVTSSAPTTAPSTGRSIAVGCLALVAVVAIAGLGVLANDGNTDGWYADAEKVAWSPPNWLFGPAWSFLYFLIALAGWLIWRAGYRGAGTPNAAQGVVAIYVVQLLLNCAWSPTFFAGYPAWGAPAWWIALAIIVALDVVVAVLILQARRFSTLAAWALVPYLGWILFATTLNIGVAVLN